jgi:hypothetical protein
VLDAAPPVRIGVRNSDVLRSYLGCWRKAEATSDNAPMSLADFREIRRKAFPDARNDEVGPRGRQPAVE